MQTFKRSLSILLCLVLLCTLLPLGAVKARADTVSGTCGASLRWSLDTAAGHLTVTGSGAMTSWSKNTAVPWYSWASSIKTVSLPQGLTYIGANAFAYCYALTSVSIPDTVITVGEQAFFRCDALTDLVLPNSVMKLDAWSFGWCTGLKSVTLPRNLARIGEGAFYRCRGLTSVQIPAGTVAIGELAFAWCDSLTEAAIPKSVTGIGEDAFGYNPLTVYGCAGSTAESFTKSCKDYGFVFVAVAPPKITAQPKNASVLLEDKTSFSITASGNKPAYQWQYRLAGSENWCDLPGATAASCSVTGGTDNNGALYRCLVYNAVDAVVSSSATLTVITPPAPTITAQPAAVTVLVGGTATFRVAASGEGTLSYKWQQLKVGESQWTAVEGGTSPELTVTAYANRDGRKYRCAVRNSGGTVTSKAVTLTVINVPTITTQPVSASAVLGGYADFTVEATGHGTLSYQWQQLKVGSSTWGNITDNGTSPTLTVRAYSDRDGRKYRCVVTNAAGSVTSNAAVLTVLYAPSVSAQPQDTAVTAGGTAVFSVTASGSAPLQYQWQQLKVGETKWTNAENGTSASLSVIAYANRDSRKYRCVITNAAGTVTTREALLTVRVPPAVTRQPASVTAKLGDTVVFTVSASGSAPLKYQWQYQNPGENSWSKVYDDGTAASLNVIAYANRDGRKYRCVITNAAGSVTSEAAVLTVVTPPAVKTQPVSATAVRGGTAVFTVSASGSAPLQYQWQQLKVGETKWTNAENGTSASLSVIAYDNRDGRKYRCVISNAAGSVTTEAVTLTVLIPPSVTRQPADTSAVVGDTAVFTVTASGTGPLKYQWQQLKPGETAWTKVYDDGTSATLNVIAYANRGGRQYRCVITNAAGSVTTEPASLSVKLHSGCPCDFIDMPAYGTVEHAAIDWACSNQITAGVDSLHFAPERTVTRGQAVTFLWRAQGSPKPKSSNNPFTDVKSDSYCYQAVLWAVENGITNGTTETTFSPNKTCNRAQMLTFLYNAAKRPNPTIQNPYSDVKAGSYYANAAIWAYEKGIEKGSGGKFSPAAACTRAAGLTWLYRFVTGKRLLQ